MDEAIAHLDRILREQPNAAVAVPVAVFRTLSANPVPTGLLASAAATYLAFDILDDQMDGERAVWWTDRNWAEIVIGAQVLLQRASYVVAHGSPPPVADRLRALYQDMFTAVAEGQLRTELPIDAMTSAASVAATIDARSGAMLAGFATMAAVAAGADNNAIEGARIFGRELGAARQHLNDLAELVDVERTADLRNRTATMAPALAMQTLEPAARALLLENMQAAVENSQIRRRLITEDLAQAIADVVVVIQLHLRGARVAAAALARPGLGDHGLEHLVEYTATSLRRNDAR